MSRIKIIFILLSLASYIAALSLPAIDKYIGLECLLAGWFSLGVGGGVPWFANFLVLGTFAFVMCGAKKIATASAFFTILLMLSSFIFNSYLVDTGGNVAIILERHIGFWLWLLTPVLLFLGVVADMINALEPDKPRV